MKYKNIKEKVLKEAGADGKVRLVSSRKVKKAIDLTLAEVGKVIDGLRKETYFGKVPSVAEQSLKLAILEKIKQKLGIK